MARVSLSYTKPQLEIFFPEKPVRFNAIAKGRRFGATRGAAHAAIEWAIEGKQILWGDTISANIKKYYERYFLPALKASDFEWEWRDRDQMLKVGSGFIDFRSADRPENWEGFGYHKIILNEAGIILKDRYLYTNAVLPMLMDFAGSELYALGVPKGKTLRDGTEHPFYTIYKRGEEGTENYRSLRYTSHDNPLLWEADIEELTKEISTMSKGEEQQEIFGFFIDHSSGFEFFTAFTLSKHIKTEPYDPAKALHESMDFNVIPHFPVGVAQIWQPEPGRWRVHFLKEYILIPPFSTTSWACDSLVKDLTTGDFAGHSSGLFAYGDGTGRNRTTMAEEEVRHNYDRVKSKLDRWFVHGSMRVVRSNPPHSKVRDFMNDCFAGIVPIEITFDPSMKVTINDMLNLKVGPDGSIFKEYETNDGARYERYGHCSQMVYYLVISAFNSYFRQHAKLAA